MSGVYMHAVSALIQKIYQYCYDFLSLWIYNDGKDRKGNIADVYDECVEVKFWKYVSELFWFVGEKRG